MRKDLPGEYFMDEVRDGFLVPGMMKKSWAMSLKNYRILASFAEESGSFCTMFFGSMIGAVRYGGNIPWDDDIDTVMLREEFVGMKSRIDAGEIPENHFLRDYMEMDNGNLVRKWMDANDVIKSRDRWEEDYGFPFVNNVDIILLDALPDSDKDRQYYTDVIDLCQHVWDFADMMERGETIEDEDEFAYSLDLLQRVLKVRYNPDTDGAMSKWTWRMLERFLGQYSVEKCGTIVSLTQYMFRKETAMPKWTYEAYVDMQYEDDTVKIPIGYDNILRHMFGDYMVPVVEFSGHSYPNYRMLEDLMREHYGMELLRYKYDADHIKEILIEKDKNISHEERSDEKKVLMLTRSSEQWKALHSLWKVMSESEDIRVTVIAVPYFYKDSDGAINENDMRLDDQGYPEDVILTRFDHYDVEIEKPDVIFFTEPYDEFNDSYTIHPYYYASHMRMFAGELILVPPFLLREITKGDERSRFTFGCWIRNIGAVLADKIYVQSDGLREVCIELLSEMCTDIDWKKRVSGLGSPLQDCPNEGVRTSGDSEYRLLYHISASVIYEHGVKVIEKARKLIKLVTEMYGDKISIVYFEDKNTISVLKEHKPRLYEQYTSFVNELKAITGVEYDDQSEEKDAVLTCDGYYGDGSVVMNHARELKKPVLWQIPWLDVDRKGADESSWSDDTMIMKEGDWDIKHFLSELVRVTDERRNAEKEKDAGGRTRVGRAICYDIINGKNKANIPFEYEVRDGFLIPGLMKRSWKKDQRSYDDLVRICDELGVEISASWGTLLGAIRNGGYIPWDDDIDLQMIHSDYDVLSEYMKNKYEGDYWISDYLFDEQENMTRRWMSGKSLIEPYEKWKDSFGFPFVSIVDVFVQDYLPIDGEKGKEYWDNLHAAGSLKEEAKKLDKSKLNREFFQKEKDLEKKLGVVISKTADKPDFIRIIEMMDKYMAGVGPEDSNYIGSPTYYNRKSNWIAEKKLYAHTIEVRFEDGLMRVPIGYDGILRNYFGNYMRPYMFSGAHSYPFYEAMNKDAKEVSGYGLTAYEWEPGKEKDDVERKLISDEVRDSLLILKEAHEYILGVIDSGEITDDSIQLIGQCQEMAIGMGNLIEERAVAPDDMISLIEKYCETVYELYMSATDGRAIRDDIGDALKKLENDMENQADKLSDIKKAVFLCIHPEEWKSLHTLWKAMNESDEWDVKVIAVPYYIKDDAGTIHKDQVITEDEGYPEEIILTPYDAYDLKEMSPDVVIYTNPYDEYGSGMCVHPYYYSSNVRMFAKKMVLVPPFLLNEKNMAIHQSKYTLGTFLKTPGGVHADLIIAQSMAMKEVCEEILDRFIPDGESVPEICAIGAPLAEWMETNHVRETNSADKKILIYTLGTSMLYEHGEKALAKALDVFHVFESYSDRISVIWKLDEYANSILSYDEGLKNSYERLVADYAERVTLCDNNGKQAEAKLAEKCDAFYGDGCTMMNECRMMGKYSLFESPDVPIMAETRGVKTLPNDELILEEGESADSWSLVEFLEAILAQKGEKKARYENIGEHIFAEIKNEI